jgi:hypothetical protein
MAGRVSNQIVEEGLIRYYDIANSRSYIGSNTVVSDLSIQNVSMSLSNSPTYVPNDYLGSFRFDGVNDGFSIPYFAIGNSPFAADIWVEAVTGAPSYSGMLSCGDIWTNANPGNLGWVIGFGLTPRIWAGACFATGSNLLTIRYSLESNVLFGRPNNILLHRNTDTQRLVCYLNGVKRGETVLTNDASFATSSFTNRTTINTIVWGAVNAGPPTGSIYNIKVYHDKNFTEREILQNYNALKWRYGL